MTHNKNIVSDTDSRTILLYDEINTESILETTAYLLDIIHKDNEDASKMKNFERKPIILYIKSSGGDMYAAWSLIDIICASKTPVYTIAAGIVESAAFMIYISGKKRYVMKHARLMFHQFIYNIHDQYDKLKEFYHTMDDEWKQYLNFTCSKTSIPPAKLEEIREKKQDYWLTPEESIKYHVSDFYYDELIGGKENEKE